VKIQILYWLILHNMTTTRTADHTLPDELVVQIDALMGQRAAFRSLSRWAEADEIKQTLREQPYNVEIIDFAEKPSAWVPRMAAQAKKSILWSELTVDNSRQTDWKRSLSDPVIPLVMCTVDTPHYRARYEETVSSLLTWQHNCCTCIRKIADSEAQACRCISFQPEPCYMLDLERNPAIGAAKIVFEGWRRKLLPMLLEKYADSNLDFIVVCEDDIRFPEHTSPEGVYDSCANAFQSNRELLVLSLGHVWKDICKVDKVASALSLYDFLRKTPSTGIHGATLIAIQFPRGVKALLDVLETAAGNKQQTHLDLFLFHSTHHNIPIALCDPPVAGWAEVEDTLTKSGSGYRRRGGGRIAFLPPRLGDQKGMRWVSRTLIKEVLDP
jgi:hypothetical protein